jgi:hypothetical protein
MFASAARMATTFNKKAIDAVPLKGRRVVRRRCYTHQRVAQRELTARELATRACHLRAAPGSDPGCYDIVIPLDWMPLGRFWHPSRQGCRRASSQTASGVRPRRASGGPHPDLREMAQ